MQIQLNGQNMTTSIQTLEHFLKEQAIESDGIAVAINCRIIMRNEWSTTNLCERDCIEIVHAVYGG